MTFPSQELLPALIVRHDDGCLCQPVFRHLMEENATFAHVLFQAVLVLFRVLLFHAQVLFQVFFPPELTS